jgi:HD-like signal output (HDOD) protein
MKELSKGDAASLQQVAKHISKDPGMSANVLKIISTKFFRCTDKIVKIEHAVNMLGIDIIKNLLLTAELIRVFPLTKENNFFVGTFLERSIIASNLMEDIFRYEMKNGRASIDDVYTAETIGMLHDVGKIVLASLFQKIYEKIILLTYTSDECFAATEKHLLGITHSEVATYLLCLWKISCRIPQTIEKHCSISTGTEDETLFVKAIRFTVGVLDHLMVCPEIPLEGNPIFSGNPEWYQAIRATIDTIGK